MNDLFSKQDSSLFDNLKKRFSNFHNEVDLLSLFFIVSVFGFFTIFLIFPLIDIILGAFFINNQFSLDYFNVLFANPDFFNLDISKLKINLIYYEDGIAWHIGSFHWNTIMNTLFVAIGTTLLATIIGVLFAYFISRHDFIGKRLVRVLILIPLIIPPFVSGIGIKRIIFSENSMFNILFCSRVGDFTLIPLFPYPIVIEGLTAVIITQSLHFFVLVYLNAAASFSNIDPTLEEQAENLGATNNFLLRTVTFPLALPGIAAGAILTFILSIEDVGTPIVFTNSGNPIDQVNKLLTYQVFTGITQINGDISNVALAMSVLLLITAMIGFMAIRKYVNLKSYSMLSKGGLTNPRIYPASRKGTIIFYLIFIPIIIIALSPHLGVILLAFTSPSDWPQTQPFPVNFSLNNFFGDPRAVFQDPFFFKSIQNTFFISIIAVLFIIIFGIAAAYVLSRKKFFGKSFLDTLVTVPIAVPGIVLGIGYFKLFASSPIDVFNPIINPLPLLIFSFAVRRFPFTVRAAYAGLQQTNEAMEEVSWNLGAGKFVTLIKIVIPLIALNVFAGALMSFVFSTSEVSTSLTLIGRGNEENPMMTTAIADRLTDLRGGLQLACALGFILMLLQIVAIFISEKILKNRSDAITGI